MKKATLTLILLFLNYSHMTTTYFEVNECPVLYEAWLIDHGTGVSTFLVTKQLALDQIIAQIGTVDFDEGTFFLSLEQCINRATPSFPTPVSPRSNTVASDLAVFL